VDLGDALTLVGEKAFPIILSFILLIIFDRRLVRIESCLEKQVEIQALLMDLLKSCLPDLRKE
jgi:hypothetical protein